MSSMFGPIGVENLTSMLIAHGTRSSDGGKQVRVRRHGWSSDVTKNTMVHFFLFFFAPHSGIKYRSGEIS